MRIGGFQKLTLVDFPGKVAATVFTQGCNFRCGYCHNPELVCPESFGPLIPVQEVLAELKTRRGKLQGVVITGGEPTLQKGLVDFIVQVKELGLAVKLDTNGSHPEVLAHLINLRIIDYIAIDIKTSIEKYRSFFMSPPNVPPTDGIPPKAVTSIGGPDSQELDSRLPPRFLAKARVGAGMTNIGSKIQESIALIIHSGLPHQFRTTVVKILCSPEDFFDIRNAIQGTNHYVLQAFTIAPKMVDPSFGRQDQYTLKEFESLKDQFEIFKKM